VSWSPHQRIARFAARHCAGRTMRVPALILELLIAASAPAFADDTVHIDAAHLKPGEYLWHPELAPAGPVVAIVSLDEQRIYVYRNGIAIGLGTISSGRRGHETPPGIYTILQKDRDHYSNLYDSAPMPFMERLTWGGVALHGGTLPGHPASHGCVRLPKAFAEALFAITRRGDTVIVAATGESPTNVVHPAMLAPIGTLADAETAPSANSFTWDESAAPDGPVSILVSLHDRRVYVLRDGVRIGSSALDVTDGFAMSGTLLLVVGEGYESEAPSRLDPSRPRHRWSAYSILSNGPAPGLEALGKHLRVPDGFARAVYAVLTPGTTVVLTDLPAVRNTEQVHPVLESTAP
jgi:L,D-transpeptidase-like protein